MIIFLMLMGQSNKILNLRLFMILLHLSPLLSKPELFKFKSEFDEILYIFGWLSAIVCSGESNTQRII